jgi:endoglucanase
MKKKIVLCLLAALLLLFVASEGFSQVYGKLSVSNGRLNARLKGMSSMGLQWYPFCTSTVGYLKEWGCTVVRAAMYTAEQGYITNNSLKNEVIKIVDSAIAANIYAIIDWHILSDCDPNQYKDQAKAFFQEMATKYGNYDHVLYEICNEPNCANWTQIKQYADYVIPAIRAIDPDNVIICGTPTWSQDVDVASQSPLSYSNVMYTLHFYAGTHGQSLRDKANTAMSRGCAVFVSEWGTSSSSGDGGPYLTQSDEWMSWMDANNLSWCNWSLCPKAESSAALKSGTSMCGPWPDSQLTTSGAYVKGKIGASSPTTPPGTAEPTNPPADTPAPTNPPTDTAAPTATPGPTAIPTATPAGTPVPTNPPADTPAPTESVTNPPAVTDPPAATNPPATGCTCPNLCSSQTSISVPFTKDGSGEFCYTSSSLATYVNSWNTDAINVNGTNCTNTYVSSSSIAAIGGVYYVYYKGSYSWSHMEIK